MSSSSVDTFFESELHTHDLLNQHIDQLYTMYLIHVEEEIRFYGDMTTNDDFFVKEIRRLSRIRDWIIQILHENNDSKTFQK